FHPQDRAKDLATLETYFATGRERIDLDVRLLVSGVVRCIHLTGLMLRDEAGKPLRWSGTVTDVTERTLATEERQRLEQQLRRAKGAEAMGGLARGIAHDFNNILATILGYGEMSLREPQRGTRLRRNLDNIVTAGERGRALVDRVLAFTTRAV